MTTRYMAIDKRQLSGDVSMLFCPTRSSPDTKKDFLKAVQSILREKQRRQLLKTESLPPNQQYVPFGGKRLSALKGAKPGMNRTGDQAQAKMYITYVGFQQQWPATESASVVKICSNY